MILPVQTVTELNACQLGATSSSSSAKVTVAAASSSSHVSITSAPEVVEFKPPTPTPQDPYPGYYLLPSGAWAAHDPDYYNVFLKKWKKEYDDQVRALEKGAIKGFEGSEESAEEVNMVTEMEKARREIQERESRKAVTTDATGEPAKPRMNIDVSWRYILIVGCRALLMFSLACQAERSREISSPTVLATYRCLSKPRSPRGEDCRRKAESQRSW